jgi:hypothetical protein
MKPNLLPLWPATLAVALTGCANYPDQLNRAEHHYQDARYEAALANLEDLEIHTPALSVAERVRYDYVRGMTHLRLNQPQDARHWLALAREEARDASSALTEEARNTIERRLPELDPLNPTPAAGSSDAPANGSSGGSSSGSTSGGSGTGGPAAHP